MQAYNAHGRVRRCEAGKWTSHRPRNLATGCSDLKLNLVTAKFRGNTVNVTVYGKILHMGSARYLRNAHFQYLRLKNVKVQFLSYFLSKNPSTNCCHHLRRVNVCYQGEISLYFDLPSQYSCHTWSPLLSAVIRILYLGIARFIEVLYICSPF